MGQSYWTRVPRTQVPHVVNVGHTRNYSGNVRWVVICIPDFWCTADSNIVGSYSFLCGDKFTSITQKLLSYYSLY